jgi:AmmeMemoRadiSam system protein A
VAANRISNLSEEERRTLLQLARESIRAAASRQGLPKPDLGTLPASLADEGACFVTLYRGKELRGCTGTLLARIPLAQEVVQTAAQTALYDPRFYPVTPDEVGLLTIEISVLTPPTKLLLNDPRDLPNRIRPGIDGVTLSQGSHRATFLPQVWDKVGDPIHFLEMLSQKMGLSAGAWSQRGTEAEVYQVEEFSEKQPGAP